MQRSVSVVCSVGVYGDVCVCECVEQNKKSSRAAVSTWVECADEVRELRVESGVYDEVDTRPT